MSFLAVVLYCEYFAGKVRDTSRQRLRDHDWTELQIAEAVSITAMFAFFIGLRMYSE